jgi:hypothetical protein
VYISPSLFITENENTKQTCEWSYETRNTKRTELSISIACAVWRKINKNRDCVVSEADRLCVKPYPV